MERRYLAIDIGASSGRHIVGWLEDGEVKTKEVYRFPNGVAERDGRLTWDVDALLGHVKAGIDKALDEFGALDSFSIDTWGCDYVLLRGAEDVRPCYAYRDNRTEAVISAAHKKVPFSELYAHTGCQFQPFNTVYQLCEDLERGRLEGVTDFLMMPEYLLWKLTGVKAKEYTNATTTGLVNAKTREFDLEIVQKLGLPEKLFPKLSQPGTAIGEYEGVKVVLCAAHDTASAVEGETGFMVGFQAEREPAYTCRTCLIPLEQVANAEKKFPAAWIGEDGASIRPEFKAYCAPLIGAYDCRFVSLR